jgi:hypothetical protein
MSTADAQTDAGGTITVTPSTDLVDGQVVQVTGTGFTPQQGVWLAQCPTGVTQPTEVIQFCNQRTTVMALPDDSGGFSVPMEVARQIPTGDCATSPGACSIIVMDLSVMSVLSPVPIHVTDGPTLSENITVVPSAVQHGDIVTVTGKNFPAGVAVSVAQCSSLRDVTDEWCGATPVTVSTDAAGAFTVALTIERAVTVGSGLTIDCVDGCVVAAFTADRSYLATDDIEMPETTLFVQADQWQTVSPSGNVRITGDLHCTPVRGGDVDIDGTLTQVVDGRTISVPFRASARCDDLLVSWEADVVGQRDARFKVGPATLTVRANETIDPFPDDDSLMTTNVDLVRPVR